ncbi:hypothetical protein [Bradyrhizobium sp. I71]|uniref:hypothetical protein n=1 Tax=Bradyrhizobium sp. I71 TaxID=2590772 RepID=UPI001EF9A648|nr:hypothetical protein [Bradyrhizobium sp. I71]ULK95940.1 hypothetical protein FJV43_24665 [Bradyrhizobium sp. I71]
MGKLGALKFGRTFLAAVAATVLISQGAMAACLSPDKQMSPQAISDFLNNPAAMLNDPANANPNPKAAGDSFTRIIENLVASDPRTLPAVIELLKTANVAQQGAIGTGLGSAANDCNVPDPKFAADIAEALAKATSTPAQTNFALATGKPIGSVAAGGAGGGVSSGGVGGSTNPTTVGSNGGTATPFSSSGTPTTGTSYFSGGVSGISAASSTTTASSSVSQ